MFHWAHLIRLLVTAALALLIKIKGVLTTIFRFPFFKTAGIVRKTIYSMSIYCFVTYIVWSCSVCFDSSLVAVFLFTTVVALRIYFYSPWKILHLCKRRLCDSLHPDSRTCATTTKVVTFQASIAQLALFSNILSFCCRHLFKYFTGPQRMIQTTNSAFSPILVCQVQSLSDCVCFCS